MTFEIARLGPASGAASVNWSTADLTSGGPCDYCVEVDAPGSSPSSATAGSDYKAVTSQPLTWTAGDQASKTVSVTINGDGTLEPDEVFNVNLSSPSGLGIARRTAEGIIDNDD
jgi:hypothetical protein